MTNFVELLNKKLELIKQDLKGKNKVEIFGSAQENLKKALKEFKPGDSYYTLFDQTLMKEYKQSKFKLAADPSMVLNRFLPCLR